mgnify:CR=1 FL=1
MSRVGCKLEDYSALVEQAQSIPRLSGRCAVFAKTDIIHRQQEGVSTPDILLGLCYAMIHNYKATIVRRLPVCKPVVFCGGVTCNSGVIRAIRDVFDLTEEELIVPEEARFEAAIGAACKAEGAFTLAQLDALSNDAMATRSTTTGLPRLELLPGTDLSEPKATGILPEKAVRWASTSVPPAPTLFWWGRRVNWWISSICAPQATRKELSARGWPASGNGSVRCALRRWA